MENKWKCTCIAPDLLGAIGNGDICRECGLEFTDGVVNSCLDFGYTHSFVGSDGIYESVVTWPYFLLFVAICTGITFGLLALLFFITK